MSRALGRQCRSDLKRPEAAVYIQWLQSTNWYWRQGSYWHGGRLHAKVAVDGHDRTGLERLCRYITRPAIASERLSIDSDGRVVYRLRRPSSDGTSAIVFEPLAFLERLAALVPRPRAHQLIRNLCWSPSGDRGLSAHSSTQGPIGSSALRLRAWDAQGSCARKARRNDRSRNTTLCFQAEARGWPRLGRHTAPFDRIG